ncbi:MAG: preprotein translocase subunit SecG [Alphaproteobacteria bacterium]|nr:preprotein translocase subunit SecG [Alphaproteobacteria bacterium]MBL0718124.1 preprotein translocase subunit SecG [Alphaproteobacteria bacterium]
MISFLITLLVIVSILMIVVILLQKSEGSGMSNQSAATLMGSMMSGSNAKSFITKFTVYLAIIFFALCILIALVSKNQMGESSLPKGLEPVSKQAPDEKTGLENFKDLLPEASIPSN